MFLFAFVAHNEKGGITHVFGVAVPYLSVACVDFGVSSAGSGAQGAPSHRIETVSVLGNERK